MERLKRNFYSLGYYCTPNLSIHQNSTQELTWNFLVTLRGLMIPRLLIPEFYPCSYGIFWDILGYFSLIRLQIVHIKLFFVQITWIQITLAPLMCFDRFLLALESRDLSQAAKRIIRVSSFPIWVMGSRTSFSVSQQLRSELSAK